MWNLSILKECKMLNPIVLTEQPKLLNKFGVKVMQTKWCKTVNHLNSLKWFNLSWWRDGPSWQAAPWVLPGDDGLDEGGVKGIKVVKGGHLGMKLLF